MIKTALLLDCLNSLNALNEHLSDSSLLHKAIIRTEDTIYGIEVADLYWNNKFIHIKNGTKSSALSHLFNQGYVSGNLLMQENFRKKCIEEFSKEFDAPDLIQNLEVFQANSNEIIFVTISNRIDERPIIPFFSKITFKNIATTLSKFGYKITIKNITKI